MTARHYRRKFTTEEALELVKRFGSSYAAAEVLGVSRMAVARRLNAEAPGWKTEHARRSCTRYDELDYQHIEQLFDDGVRLADIAAETGMCIRSLSKLIRRRGWKRRRPTTVPDFDRAEVEQLLQRFGTQTAVAEVLGVSNYTVRKALGLR